MELQDQQKALLLKDVTFISEVVRKGVDWLIGGGVNASYKANFERVAHLYADACVKVIHLAIQKFSYGDLTKDDLKDIKINKLFESLYIILVDSIASGLSFDFVD